MLKRLLLAFAITLKIIALSAHAEERNLDLLLQNDRDERIQRINEMTIQLNQSLAELNKVQRDLDTAVANENKTKGVRITIRNASAAAAAIGIAGSILYQMKGVSPSKVVLAGGIGLSVLAGTIAYMENKSIRLTHEEVENLRASIKDLLQKIEIEKRNLNHEIRLLCLEQGGAPEQCDQ